MDNKKIQAKLEEIQGRMPQSIRDRLFKRKEAYDAIKEVMSKALEEPIGMNKREELEAILGSGMLDKEIVTTNEDVEKEADEWMTREINLAIKRGELPKPKNPFRRKRRK